MPAPTRDAWCFAMGSGVTENHPSSSIFIPLSKREKSEYRWFQYLAMSLEMFSAKSWHEWTVEQNKWSYTETERVQEV
jgi:hypothetical protein